MLLAGQLANKLFVFLSLSYVVFGKILLGNDSTPTPRPTYFITPNTTAPTAPPTFVYVNVETNILQELFYSTDGTNWRWKTPSTYGRPWDFTHDADPCDNWQGVTCEVANSTTEITPVLKLGLMNYGLRGSLPDSIVNLTSLTNLNLSHNHLTSTLPNNIGQLVKLEKLTLENNRITGPIPSSLGDCDALTELRLKFNNFSSSLPESLGQLSRLVYLDIQHTQITGQIPETFSGLSSLQILTFAQNQLSGTFPEGLCALKNLSTLSLYHNTIAGSLPPCMGNLTALARLNLNDNQLSGVIPASAIGRMSVLQEVNLANNNLHGPLPDELFANCSEWDLLDLSANYQLSGSIPAAIGNCKKLTAVSLYYNVLHGSLPASISDMTQLTILDVSYNFITGPIPDEFGALKNMVSFTLSNNLITGTIPEAMGTIEAMTTFGISSNLINGTVPESLYSLPRLHDLVMSSNRLTGTLSSKIGGMFRLTSFAIANNQFTHTIPVEIGYLNRLTALLMNNNLFSGPLPSSVSNMTAITTLRLNNNLLTGAIPDSYGSFLVLTGLYLNYNQLSHTIPASLGQLAVLQSVSLMSNQLTGSVPNELANCLRLNQIFLFDNLLTGTLPANLTAQRNTVLQYISVNNNLMSGTVPSDLDNMHTLLAYSASYNLLTGTLPPSIGLTPVLQYLAVGNNFLSGTIPPSVSGLRLLIILFVQNNRLGGNLDLLVNSTLQQFVTNIDVSNNQITGTIPSEPFLIPSLQTFAAVCNCLTGSIPLQICGASSLVSLAMDGLSTASSCQNRYLHSPYLPPTYGLRSSIQKGLPACLFNMSSLETLHFSGNGITGGLGGSDLVIGERLNDLSLSYNILSGTIPEAIQSRSWSNLDLSYNKLTGVLLDSLAPPGNNSLLLKVNRLSGEIPRTVLSATNISILSGNIYTCGYYSSGELPAADSSARSYSCGSNNVNLALYFYIGAIGVSAVLILLVWKVLPTHSHSAAGAAWTLEVVAKISLWLSVFRPQTRADKLSHKNIVAFGAFLAQLRSLSLALAVYLLVVALPLFSGLTALYNTYYFEYAYTLGAVYLSGFVPAVMIVLVSSLVLLGLIYHMGAETHTNIYTELASTSRAISTAGGAVAATLTGLLVTDRAEGGNRTRTSSMQSQRRLSGAEARQRTSSAISASSESADQLESQAKLQDSSSAPASTGGNNEDVSVSAALPTNSATADDRYAAARERLTLVAILAVNAVMIVLVNVGYILIAGSDDTTVVITTQMGLATFKIGWNRALQRVLVHRMNRNRALRQKNSNSDSISDSTGDNKVSSGGAAVNGSRSIMLLVVVELFNNIVVPCLATLAISPNCFNNIINAPSNVQSSYSYQQCAQLATNTYSKCTEYSTETSSTSYFPPFNYSYQCSSVLVRNYASVYVFMFLIKTFAMHLPYTALLAYQQRRNTQNQPVNRLVLRMLPKLLWPFDLLPAALSRKVGARLFSQELFVLRLISNASIFLTFGVMFPPLALVACVAQFTHTYGTQLILGRFVSSVRALQQQGMLNVGGDHKNGGGAVRESPAGEARELTSVVTSPLQRKATDNTLEVTPDTASPSASAAPLPAISPAQLNVMLEADCAGVSSLFWRSLYPLFPLASVFYSFFVYDAYGDVVGWRRALWLVLLTAFMPVVVKLLLLVADQGRDSRSAGVDSRRNGRGGVKKGGERRDTIELSTRVSSLQQGGRASNANTEVSNNDDDEDDKCAGGGGGGGGIGEDGDGCNGVISPLDDCEAVASVSIGGDINDFVSDRHSNNVKNDGSSAV